MGYVHRWSYEAQEAFPALKKQQEKQDAADHRDLILFLWLNGLILIVGVTTIIVLSLGGL